jgi:malate dehydrogenase (oxaloacetate-decarboxylating)(NADP+)
MRYFFQNKARSTCGTKRVEFAEGEESKVIRAAYYIIEEGVATLILIGRLDVIQKRIDELGLQCCP